MSQVDWKGGMRFTQKRMRDITPAWREWTPAWTTTSGSNTPSFGDAGIVAEYMEAGGLCIGKMTISFGSTTDFGGGGSGDNWRFSLPVEAASSSLINGWAMYQDTSAGIGSRVAGRVRADSTTTFVMETDTSHVDGTGLSSPNWGVVDATTPWAWADGDAIRCFFQYPTAA